MKIKFGLIAYNSGNSLEPIEIGKNIVSDMSSDRAGGGVLAKKKRPVAIKVYALSSNSE